MTKDYDIHTRAGKRAFMYQYLAALRKSMIMASSSTLNKKNKKLLEQNDIS